MTRVGFVGLGAMGSRMAQRLVEAGYELTVWNRTAANARPLAAGGARVASTPSEAAAAAEVVVTMVRDAVALGAVIGGHDGLGAGLRDGSILVDMSTVGPDALYDIARGLPSGVTFLDAPVLGSLDEAREGRLRIFAGGDEQPFRRVEPLLERLGEPLLVGPFGSGAAAKLVANSTLFAVVAALGEAIVLGEKLGLAGEEVFAVLAETPLAAQAERRRGTITAGEYEPRFKLALALKDAELVVEAATRRGLELRLAEAARASLAAAEADGWGERDYSGLIGWLLRASERERTESQ